MKIFDTHCHLDDACYEKDIEEVIKRAEQNDIYRFMTVGTNKNTSYAGVKLSEKIEGCFASVGVHPHDAKSCSDEVINFLKNISKHKKVKAWGEIGLDFNRMFSPDKIQEKWFIKQIEAAKEALLPVIFHERDSNKKFYEILKTDFNHNEKGVVHCFSGDEDELEKYLDMGLYIGITGIVTILKRGERLRRLVSIIPDNLILIETDAPYLTPAPEKNKNRRNEPAFVKSVLLKLAEIKNIEPEILSETIWQNSCNFFDIKEDI